YLNNRKDIGYVSSTDIAMLKNKVRPELALNPPFGDNFFKLFSDGKLAIVQNVGYAIPNRSHFRATDIWNSASDSEVVVSTGWMGRYLETQEAPDYPIHTNSNDPIAISIDYATTLVFQGSKAVMAAAVNDPSNYNAAKNYADDAPPVNNYGTELNFLRGILTQSDVYGARFKSVFS